MTKRVNKAQEKKPEGSKSQSNIPQIILANIISAYVIFILLVCNFSNILIFLKILQFFFKFLKVE